MNCDRNKRYLCRQKIAQNNAVSESVCALLWRCAVRSIGERVKGRVSVSVEKSALK